MTILILSNLLAWSVQVALIVLATLITMKLIRLDAPAVRYTVLRIVLAVCLLLPFVQPQLPVTARLEGKVGTSIAAVQVGASEPSGPRDSGQAFGIWMMLLVGVLGGGMFARLTWMGLGVVRLHDLRRAGEIAPSGGEHEELQSIIGTRATIRYVAALGQPVTFGFRRPVVLLPESLRVQPEAIQRAVLAHELWHVRRKDWIWTVAEESVRAVLWFHPAIWALLSTIQSTREEVVDELTILATGSRRSYVDALLAFADKSPIFAATAFARRRHLVHRMVLISKEAVMSARRVVICCVVLAAAVGATGWYAVHAFPLVQAQSSPELFTEQPGTVERRAKPITPENPIPRRIRHVEAQIPAEAETVLGHGTMTVRAVVDESGRVAESRVVGMTLSFKDNQIGMSIPRLSPARFESALKAQYKTSSGESIRAEAFRDAIEAMAREAARAVNQWQYAPPADGPIAFDVRVPVGDAPPPPPPPPPPAPRTSPRPSMPPPPPPPPPIERAQQVVPEADAISDGALRIGGSIKAPTKTKNVPPVYPLDAQTAKVQGVVIIEARIEADGTVSQTRVLKSIPMLDDAAVDAVRQWEFTPTWLNGQPVPVLMTTTVNFTLQ